MTFTLLQELLRRGGTIDNEQFFTKASVAKHVSDVIKSQSWFGDIKTFVEPSAGAGALLRHFPGAKGFDLVPQADGIEQADFLKLSLATDPSTTLVFGNPPFGRNGSLALQFVRKAMKLADRVAFILPNTFAKSSMQARIPAEFRLTHEELLPVDAFEAPDGTPLDVRCVFQIWERGAVAREIEKFDQSKTRIQLVKPEQADFAVRKVGDKSLGRIYDVAEAIPTASFFFIKDSGGVREAVKRSTWDHIVGTAAGGLRSIDRLTFIKTVEKNL